MLGGLMMGSEKSLEEVIKNTLKNHRLQHQEYPDGGGYQLVDALTPDSEGSITKGLEEIDLLADDLIDAIQEQVKAQTAELVEALRLASIRLKILTGRMRACNEETGVHELLGEAEMFVEEAKVALSKHQQEFGK